MPRLQLRDLEGGPFVVRLVRAQPDGKRFASAGRIDLLLDCEGRASVEVERFVRALAARIHVAAAGLGEAELDLLASPSGGAPPSSGPDNAYRRRHAAVGTGAIVDFNVGDGCNLFCTFCTDEHSRGRELARPTAFWREELARARASGKRGLLISGNEPTLRGDLPELIAEARRLGFEEIELSTAGVRLADRAYLAELLDAGLHVLAISLHGSNAEIDGRCTGRPEFFAPRQRGIEHFLDLVGDRSAQAARGVFLKTISIFTRQNLDDIPSLAAWLEARQVTYAVIYYPWIKGGALDRFAAIVPDYPSVARAITPITEALRHPSGWLDLANLPPCVIPELRVDRTVEKAIVRAAPSGAVPEGALRVLSATDPSLTFAEPCAACALRGASCQGVPRPYLDHYGPSGLRALSSPTR